jgi:hypothetical protein
MPSVSTTTSKLTLIFFLFSFVTASAQENSPYSRYGMGDIYPSQNIVNRAMGGLTAAYTDLLGQSINFSNPASYADFQRLPGLGGKVLYDIGLSIDSRSLKSKLPLKNYSSANFIPSYISLGFPIAKGLGGAFGLRPYSRINYSIIQNTRLAGIDSAQYKYDGSGGLNQAFLGVGKRWNNFSIGFNTGYFFGKKETSTKLGIVNTNTTDTGYTPFFYSSNSTTSTSFGKLFFSAGAMYDIQLKSIPKTDKKLQENYGLRLGATAMFRQKFKGSQNITRETFDYDAAGGTITIDSVYTSTGTRIDIEMPATYTIGAMLHKSFSGAGGSFDSWMIGAELETSKWSQFRYGGLPDKLTDYWQLRIGGQFLPSSTSTTLLGRSVFRFGVNFGKDYINADNNELKTFSGSFGIGVPIRPRGTYTQVTNLNLALEAGKRGSGVNNVTESYFRISAGFSLSDIWFHKRKYD